MTTQINLTTTAPQRDAERPSRSRTLAKLVSLLVELPAPTDIHFREESVSLHFACTADFDRWAAWHDAKVQYRDLPHADTLQSLGYAEWSGWHLSLNVVVKIDDDRLTARQAAAAALSAVTE